MARVLLLGAGMVARPLARYLLEQPGFELTIASRTLSKAQALIAGHPSGKALEFLVDDAEALSALVAEHDLAISLLPYSHHARVAEQCIRHGKHMVTTSYISAEMRALDESARAAGVTILNEIGVDPGIDHMSAMRVIHGVAERGGKITSFSSYCGGLPAPEANTNPWGYKFSWSPRGVLLAGKNDGRFLRNGQVVEIPGAELFAHYEGVEVPEGGVFEGYTNRDCLGYIELYGLEGIANMFRGTLRYPGWCDTLKAFADLGYLDDRERPDLAGKSYADLARALLASDAVGADLPAACAAKVGIAPDSEPIRRFQWLGLFTDEKLPAEPSILDMMVARMLARMAYEPGERDMLVLHHQFEAEFPDHREALTSTMLDYGIPGGDSSMSRTVSLPAAIATRLILEGRIAMAGVHAPVHPSFYLPVLAELERLDIVCKERGRTI